MSPFHLIQRVVLVLEIGAIERDQDDEEPLIRRRADKGVLLPRPWTAILERGVGEAEPPATFRVRARTRRVGHYEGREVVHRRLVIADCPEHMREHDLRLCFCALLDMPLTPL